jgi:two-component system phosphate regulon sensor histidine kinase PhoR
MVSRVGRVKRTKNRQRLGYRRIVALLVYLNIVPTVLLLAIGIVAMSIGEVFNLVFGVLTVSFVAALVTGAVLVLVFLRREANLSELQSDFVSKVSHELRTPLTGIQLLVETLERSRGKADVEQKCLAALQVETERLTARIERLLDWGRMEAGRKQFDLHEVAATDVIKEAVDAFAVRRLSNDVSLECEIEANLPTIFADGHAIVDALGNLLSNALKYGGTPPVITIHAFAMEGFVALEVKDNGEGIPRPEHRRIFDKFYRIDDRLSRAREGSGLGLAIVKHIVRAHGGRIQLDSAKGRGSTFRLVLPKFRQSHAKPAAGPAAPPALAHAPEQTRST